MISIRRVLSSLVVSVALSVTLTAQHAPPQGIFTGSTDIGAAQRGSSLFDPATASYKVSGGGQDVWGAADDFHLTWVKFSGDGSLTANVEVSQPGTHAKAKGMLMFRQSLDPGSPYADIALHADGHIDLQWRATTGGETKDTDLPQHNAVRLRIERKGDRFTAYALGPDGTASGEPLSVTIPMQGPIYVGIGVCSHSTTALQTVTFSNVALDRITSIPKSAKSQ